MPISPVCRRGPRSGRPSLSRKWGATSPCVESAVTAWEPQRFVVTERTTYGAGSLSRRIQLPHFPYEHFSLTLSCSWVRNCWLRVDPPSRKAAGLPVRSTTATIAPELSREKQPAHRPIDAKGGFLAVSRQGKENMNIGAKKWALMCPLRDIRGHSIFFHQWAPTLQPFRPRHEPGEGLYRTCIGRSRRIRSNSVVYRHYRATKPPTRRRKWPSRALPHLLAFSPRFRAHKVVVRVFRPAFG